MLLEMNYLSEELGKNTQIYVFLPDKKAEDGAPRKTLWLLHGLKGDHTSWLRNTNIERYAAKHDLAVVMPNTERSWYTNTQYGANYFNFLTEELPEVCRRNFAVMSDRREDNIIAGLSMGGYGAFKLAFSFPDRYAYCISLSGALDVTRKGRPYSLPEWQSIFGYGIQSALDLENSEHDIFHLAEKNKAAGAPFPKIYMCCGSDDPLFKTNVDFHEHLTKLGVEHTFEASEGSHVWRYWEERILPALNHVLKD